MSDVHRTIRHCEECSATISEVELQRILFAHFKVRTGNFQKMQVEGAEFPLRITWSELLEHDSRTAIVGEHTQSFEELSSQ